MSIFALNLVFAFVTPAAVKVNARPAIPYRNAAAVSTSGFVFAMVITALVLAALVACALYARRRGWVVGAGVATRPAGHAGIELQASKRLSLATTAHVIAYNGLEYLIVESGRGSVATISPLVGDRASRGGTP